MAGLTAGLMLNMRDSVEQQLVLNLLTGTEMTFDSNEVRTISRLAQPARMRYKEIQIVDPATVFLRYGSTNGGHFYREGQRMRITDPGLPFALYFKRLTNNPEAAQP